MTAAFNSVPDVLRSDEDGLRFFRLVRYERQDQAVCSDLAVRRIPRRVTADETVSVSPVTFLPLNQS